MAKVSAVQKNKRRARIVEAKGARRDALRAIIRDKSKPLEERFEASLKLSKEPKASLIASATAPVASPPPFGDITSQNKQWL